MDQKLDSSPPFHTPEIIPSRQSIRMYGLKRQPGETDHEYSIRKAEEPNIAKEAQRRFKVTLNWVLEKEPRENYRNWRHVIDDEYEAADAEVMKFFQEITGLRIIANSQLDQYMANRQIFNLPNDDPVRKTIESTYQSLVKNLYDQYYGVAVRLYGPPSSVEDNEDPFYPSAIVEIRVDDYMDLASKVAAACAANSYLEELFQIFPGRNSRDNLDILYQEKLIKFAQQELKPPEIDPKLKDMELQIRSYIKELYKASTDLPPLIYIAKEHAKIWEEKLGSPSPIRGRRGGAYIYDARYVKGEVIIPINLCYVIIDETMTLIDQARIVFEELYHSSGGTYAQQSEVDLLWPGLQSGYRKNTLFEEGLTSEEGVLFFDTYHPEEIRAEGTVLDQLELWLAGTGPKPVHEPDILPGFVLKRTIQRCGGKAFL